MRVHITLTDDKGNTYDGIAELTRITTKPKAPKNTLKPQSGPKKAPQVINELYLNEYFKEGQHIDAVIKKLSEMRFNFSKDAITKALQRAEYLTNKGNRTYIERYPPG